VQEETHAEGDSVQLVMRKDFRPDKVSERELECLRSYLPGLIVELLQAVAEEEKRE
jgi:hypothetical protein